MLFRTTLESDLDRLLACAVTEPIGHVTADDYRTDLTRRQYRPEWTWIAEDGGTILARAVWWGPTDADHPRVLDCVYVHESVSDRATLAADLLLAAHDDFAFHGAPNRPDFHLRLAPGWRDDPAATRAVAWRRDAARRAGLTDELERLGFEWTPGAGVPEPTDRLVFTPEPDDDAFTQVLLRVAVGTLDVTTLRGVDSDGAELQAKNDLALYRDVMGHRDLWRVATTPEGELVGFAIPTYNPYGAVVGYLGVIPEMRGRGYIDEILGEVTRIHAAAGAESIRADTDVTNIPMAAAFERAGYRNDRIRLVLSAPRYAL